MPRKKLPVKSIVYKDHRVGQLWGVKDPAILSDIGVLTDKLNSIAKQLELTVVNTFSHQFNPYGLSIILVVAESHMAVHTWPEHNYLHIDLFTCSPDSKVKELKKVLKKEIPADKVSVGTISYMR